MGGTALLVVALTVPLLTSDVGATASPPLAVLNGTINAAGVLFVAGSSAFPNFVNGAFDNSYPLAHAHVDGSPFAEGTASPLDTGPFGQALASGALTNSPPLFKQAQYADARFPSGSSKTASFGSPGGPYAQASASQNAASAFSTYASSASPPLAAGPAVASQRLAGLRAAILAWRHEWLDAADAVRHRPTAFDAAAPDHLDGATSIASVRLNPATGVLTAVGETYVEAASLGGGMIQLSNIHVAVTITNSGSPQHTLSVRIGSASIGGVPVTIDQNGVSVAGTQVPGVSQGVAQASAALNAALAQGGYHLSTVAPAIKTSGNQQTIDAPALQVKFTQPPTAPGVPQQYSVIDIGDVFADNLAVPGSPTAGIPPIVTTGTAASPGLFVPGTAGTPGTPGTPGVAVPGTTGPAGATAPNQALPGRRLVVRRSKPTSLVLLYFLWQSLIIGTIAALWWRRAEASA
jgi:hypothetical protein